MVKNRKPTHGKVYAVNKVGQPELLENLPKTFQVTRYHSLQLQQLPQEIIPILETNSGEIMGIQHSFLPIVGVQYHPEALLTEYGLELIHSWLK